MTTTIIWLTEERTYGILVSLGAYVSRVRYTYKGIDYDTYVENDEFEIWEESGFDEEN